MALRGRMRLRKTAESWGTLPEVAQDLQGEEIDLTEEEDVIPRPDCHARSITSKCKHLILGPQPRKFEIFTCYAKLMLTTSFDSLILLHKSAPCIIMLIGYILYSSHYSKCWNACMLKFHTWASPQRFPIPLPLVAAW